MTHYKKDQYAAALDVIKVARIVDPRVRDLYDTLESALRILAGQDDRFVVVPRFANNKMLVSGVQHYNFWQDLTDKSNSARMVDTVYKAMLAASEETE